MRYISDQSTVGFFYESGLYGEPTGTAMQWIGQVQSHDIDESVNVTSVRYVGGGDRNVDTFTDGMQDYIGTLTFLPQDWKFLGFALGSVQDTGSPSPYIHNISESNSNSGYWATSGTLNPFASFTIEDTHEEITAGSHFKRTINGCIVNTMTVTAPQGENMSVEVNYVGQALTFASGAATAVTAAVTRPFRWDDAFAWLPSGVANEIVGVKEWTWTINNNLETPHYLTGSRNVSVPIPLNRDYEVTLTIDSNSVWTKRLYDEHFQGGSTFNLMLGVIGSDAGAGSRDAYWVMSGCKVTDMEAPTPNEGVAEQTITIVPQNCIVEVNDTIFVYNSGSET